MHFVEYGFKFNVGILLKSQEMYSSINNVIGIILILNFVANSWFYFWVLGGSNQMVSSSSSSLANKFVLHNLIEVIATAKSKESSFIFI